MSAPHLGMYVHHRGAGHASRARVIARELIGRGWEVTLLGSESRHLPGSPLPDRGVHTVVVPRDDDAPGWDERDPTAGGRLHWAPLQQDGLRARMAVIAAWVAATRPAAFLVDVSVEVTVFVRLMGVPVIVMGQPGDRLDPPHRLGYDLADAVIAPWPATASSRETPWSAKTVHVGGISRFIGRAERSAVGTGRALMLAGADGFDLPGLPAAVADATPSLSWTIAGGRSWVGDVGSLLASADVVISHAGQNAIADIAAWHVPAVVIAQPRPHREQECTATTLRERGLARVVEPVDAAAGINWPDELQAAMTAPDRWSSWQTTGAAGRAADTIEQVAARRRPA